MRKFCYVFAVVILLTPIGLLAEGTAWGEWGAVDIEERLGYIPAGLSVASEWWNAVLPDYAVPVLGDSGWGQRTGYMLSALIGSGIVYIATLILTKLAIKNGAKS